MTCNILSLFVHIAFGCKIFAIRGRVNLIEGKFIGHSETVTFIAVNGDEMHKWRSVNVGSFEKDFSKVVHPAATAEIVRRLRAGETVEFPSRYECVKSTGLQYRCQRSRDYHS